MQWSHNDQSQTTQNAKNINIKDVVRWIWFLLISFCMHFSLFFSIAFYSTAETILGRHSTMEIRSIHLGGMFHAEEEIQMTSTMANFVGQLQGFVYNGNRYCDFRSNCLFFFFIAIYSNQQLLNFFSIKIPNGHKKNKTKMIKFCN